MRSLNYALVCMSFFIFSQENINAQTPAPLPLMVPPSPNAAALGEYGKNAVGLFTGTIQQNIPLYTIEAGAFSLPISLSYQSNGLRVSDIGSNVGLGWVLDAGGVITRTVNDETDEYGSSKIVVPPVSFNTQTMTDFLKLATSDNTLDGEADLFSFNFGSYSGKFFLTGAAPNMQAILISPSPLKIELLTGFYSGNDLISEQIKITDPTGVVYFFGGSNAVEQSDSRTYGSGSGADNPQSKMVKTAWNLTRIKLLNSDEINFTYARQLLKYDAGISQTLTSSISFKTSTGYSTQKAVHALPKVTGVNVASSKLTEINWKTGKISFVYSLRFTGGTTYFEKIDNMIIYTKNNAALTTLQKYSFNYLTVDCAYPNPDNLNGNYIDARKRLFLTALISQSPANTELNRYTFEYYNTLELPNRLSYAQDYWGYFNGKSANQDLVTNDVSLYNPGYYQNSGVFSQDGIRQLFSNVGGDKRADGQYAVKGMLQKITYPTGGYSSFEYESHATGKIEDVSPAGKKDVALAKGETMIHTTPVVPFTQYHVELEPYMYGDGCINDDQNHINYKLTVTDMQSNTNIPLEMWDPATSSYISIATPKTILYRDLYTTEPHARFAFSFVQGKTYKFTLEMSSTCTTYEGGLNFSYYDQNATQQWVNRPVGGMRIKKITTTDLTGNEQIKRYYYGSDFSCLTCSSGNIRVVEPAIAYYESLSQVQNNGVNEQLRVLKANLMSNPLHDLYNSQGSHISYTTVIEGNGDNLEGGATIHNFNNVPEIIPIHYRDPVIGAPFINVFGNGEELKTINYKNNAGTYVKVTETNYNYVTDNRIYNVVPSFKASKRGISYLDFGETYNLSVSGIYSRWRYLNSSSEISYDQNGANGSSVTTFYEYGNPVHMQPTATSTILENAGASNQRASYTKRYFLQDYTFPGTLTGTAAALKSMSDKHIWSSPIEELNYTIIGSTYKLIGGGLTTFKTNGTSIVKDKEYNIKYNNATIYQDLIGVTPATINSSGQFVFDAHYEQLNSYNRYDTGDNLLEAKDRKDTIALICEPNTGDVWAKVSNSNYANAAYSSFEHTTPSSFTNWSYNVAAITTTGAQNGVKAYILTSNPINSQALVPAQKYKVSFWRKVSAGTIFSVKASGVTVTLRTGPQRNGWQYYEGIFTGATTLQITGDATIDELRLYPQSARMTSYVYKDGVGPTSQCNENNQTTYWEYDEFNRLKLTRDQDGNILKKNEYKYQQQN
jgi:hypothetical protein